MSSDDQQERSRSAVALIQSEMKSLKLEEVRHRWDLSHSPDSYEIANETEILHDESS